MKSNYVAGFLFTEDRQRVVLIQKQRPQWQRGLFNGVGGKIEEGETPEQAMFREFSEETRVDVSSWLRFSVLSGENDNSWNVNFFCAFDSKAVERIKNSKNSPTDERLFVFYLDELKYVKTIPNLRWLIPMALSMEDESAVRFSVNEVYSQPWRVK